MSEKVSRFYTTNQIVKSPLTGNYYFVPKAELLGGRQMRVVGKKYDVTDSVEALLKADRAKRKKKP